MKNLIYIIVILFTLVSCNEDGENPDYSDCIKNKIEEYLKSPTTNPKTYIKEYIYNGQTVYLVNTNIPDGASTTVFNQNCEVVCASGSTIAGEPFDTCLNWDKAIFVKIIWVDNR